MEVGFTTESRLIPIYKQSREVLNRRNHRGITLTEYLLKVLKRLINSRLGYVMEVSDMHFGYMNGKNAIYAIYIIRQVPMKELKGEMIN